jgi:hypothetical protein
LIWHSVSHQRNVISLCCSLQNWLVSWDCAYYNLKHNNLSSDIISKVAYVAPTTSLFKHVIYIFTQVMQFFQLEIKFIMTYIFKTNPSNHIWKFIYDFINFLCGWRFAQQNLYFGLKIKNIQIVSGEITIVRSIWMKITIYVEILLTSGSIKI